MRIIGVRMGLLYYLPERKHATLANVQGEGLGYAFEADCTPRGVERGPDDQRGVIVADAERVKRIGYYPNEQTWRRIPGGRAWVGRYNAEPVRPADLARGEMLSGHNVKLGDGQQWMIPLARASVDQASDNLGWYCALPERITVDENGAWQQGEVVARYRALWQIALRWWDTKWALIAEAAEANSTDEEPENKEGKTPEILTLEQVHDGALLAVATNYRVAKAEVALLELFEDRSVGAILNALIDWPTVEAWVERQANPTPADGSSSEHGPPAEVPATGPA